VEMWMKKRIHSRELHSINKMTEQIRNPHSIICHGRCKQVYGSPQQQFLTEEDYDEQMRHADQTWQCPECGFFEADWDDTNEQDYYDWLDEEFS